MAVPNAAESVTISPTFSDTAATATYLDVDGGTLADADPTTSGHQVNVPVGTYVIDVKVAKPGGPSITYTVVVERDSAERFGWTPTRDLNTFYQDNPEAAGQNPRGVWGDDTTLYVAPHNRAKVFAFNRADGTRDQEKDIVISSDFPTNPVGRLEPIIFAGIWSDGTTMWVVDYDKVHDEFEMDMIPSTEAEAHGKLFAYRLVDGDRDKDKEFVLDEIHARSVRGVWSNGTTLWVSDYKLQKLFAYHLKDTPGTMENEFGTRDETKDITLHHLNNSPQGIWSDGTTIWVAQFASTKFFAYTLDNGMYDPDKDFDRAPDNIYPRDIWSDGTTLYVPDHFHKLYSYRMGGPGALLTPSALTVDEGTTGSYTVELTEAPTGRVTVTVGGAGVTVSPRSLSFTTSNWNSPQPVGVTAGEDANAVDETVTLTHTASGGGYGGVDLPALRVTVADNDGGIVADKTDLTVAEEGSVSDSYGLTLTRGPSSAVTVTVEGTGGKVSVNPATLTFTADTWDTAQTVMVTGEQDVDKNDETVTLRHTATGGGYAVTVGSARSAPVVVTVEDDEATVPGAPNLVAAAGHESAILRWTPGDDGGAPVTKFQYRQGTSGASKDADSLRGHTVTGLVNHNEYSFQVTAVNRKGNSVWSEAKTVTPVPLTLTVEAVEDEVTGDRGRAGALPHYDVEPDAGGGRGVGVQLRGRVRAQPQFEGGRGDQLAWGHAVLGGQVRHGGRRGGRGRRQFHGHDPAPGPVAARER